MRRALAAGLLVVFAASARPDPQVDAAIRALRRDSSLKVRTQAAIVLGQRGAQEAAVALREAIAEDDASAVRIAAVAALAKMGARAARATLRHASEADPDGAVRRAAERALMDLGPLAVAIEEPAGPATARGALKEALATSLRDKGFTVEDGGELRVKSTVKLDVTDQAGRTVIAVRTSLVVVDGDGRMEMMESSAKASVAGVVPDGKLAAYAVKAIEATVHALADDLAAKLGER